MRAFPLIVLCYLAAGCDSDSDGSDEACLTYTASYQTCIDTALDAGLSPEVDDTEPAVFCEGEAGTSEEVWSCRTDAYDNGDCESAPGLLAIGDALVACES